MKKLAIFVEGLTEQLFVQKLLVEIAAKNHFTFELRRAFGGNRVPRRLITLTAANNPPDPSALVMIIDCGTDNRVMSDVRDTYDKLVASDYSGIIALRDVYPEDRGDLPKLELGAKYGIKTVPVLVNTVFAVMEVEAWFIAEYTHFQRIDPALTKDFVEAKMGFDITACAVEDFGHPADILNQIYQLAGHSYVKRRDSLQSCIDAIDYAALYFGASNRSNSFRNLLVHLDTFVQN